MKKGDILEGKVLRVDYPGKGVAETSEGICIVKNVLPGQRIRFRVTKKRSGRAEGTLQEVLEKAPAEREAPCPYFGQCGGCQYLNLDEKEEAALKCSQVRRLLEEAVQKSVQLTGEKNEEYAGALSPDRWFAGILTSPKMYEYRNKMEYTFGDEYKDGPLALGMHRRGGFYDIVTVDGCRLVDPDFSLILRTVLDHFQEEKEKGRDIPFYHRLRHTGYLRHLLVRRAAFTGEILIDLVTTTQMQVDLSGLTGRILALGERLRGQITGILHTSNDSLADIISDQGTEILYGTDHFTEELLGLRFTVTPFSFFQTNSHGAEVLYETARKYLLEAVQGTAQGAVQGVIQGTAQGVIPGTAQGVIPGTAQGVIPGTAQGVIPGAEPGGASSPAPAAGITGRETAADPEREAMACPINENTGKDAGVVYDLYCGTGTIAQLMAPWAKKVIGVEIVEEAVEAARINAKRNGLTNCEFIAGDVLKVLDEIEEKPDTIILDPPRDGVHPKALPRILNYGVQNILYISCKPTSLARDLPAFITAGYRPVRGICVDQFPWTSSVESICLLERVSKRKADAKVHIDVDLEDYYRIKDEQKKNKASEQNETPNLKAKRC